MAKEMMITAKTLGREPGCVVMSIGAVCFDRERFDEGMHLKKENQFYVPISSFDSSNCGLQSHPDTLRWWKKQKAWALIGEEIMNTKVTVANACKQLKDFILEHKPKHVWSNSPSFHIEVLKTLFSKVDMSLPINYRDEMDFRTVLELAYGDRNSWPQQPEYRNGFIRNHALGDVISQAQDLISSLRKLENDPAPALTDQSWMMMDIETLGLRKGDAIMSIGATLLDLKSLKPAPKSSDERKEVTHLQEDKHFYVAINNFDLSNMGFVSEEKTLRWWRSMEIWKELSEEMMRSKFGVQKTCKAFVDYVAKNKPQKIWANSPSFDVAMVRHMFSRVGMEFPFTYQQEMDYRTVMNIAFPVRENRPAHSSLIGKLQHHALGDAVEQSEHLRLALQKIWSHRLDKTVEQKKASDVQSVEQRVSTAASLLSPRDTAAASARRAAKARQDVAQNEDASDMLVSQRKNSPQPR